MGFTFSSDACGRSQIVLSDEPDYVVPLTIAPLRLEEQLRHGKWLVVSMSVWSIHDIRAGHRAIEMVKRHHGLVNLGLRPYDYPQENLTWISGHRAEHSSDAVQVLVTKREGRCEVKIEGNPDKSPVWVVIESGKVIHIRFGDLSHSEIDHLISRLFAAVE